MITFTIDDDEEKRLNDWKKDKHSLGGAIGGSFTYKFTPTSIGTIVSVTFGDGTKKENTIVLSDFENW